MDEDYNLSLMNTKQIYKILSSDETVKNKNFLGVFPSDKVPTDKLQFPCSAVINNQPHDEKGEHWVAFFISEDRKGYYFDSFGFAPYNMQGVAEALDICDEWTFNDTQLQSYMSTVCGEYTIFFITHIARGFTMAHITYLLNDAGDTMANDSLVLNYIKEKYKNIIDTSDFEIMNLPFIFMQASHALSM